MSQSPLEEFHKEQAEAFAAHISSVRGIEARMKSALAELAQRQVELDQEVQTSKALNEDLRRQKEKVSVALQELASKQNETKARNKELEAGLKALDERNKKLGEKQKAQAEEHIRLATLDSNLKKREQELEMDERRNKYFEHRLNLVAGDAKIKAELEKLGDK